ncbi:MAG: lipid-binding protein [Acidobacteria bacterium]|nr:MAG: lipid-binding protein [Acidobacteriota bacterium]
MKKILLICLAFGSFAFSQEIDVDKSQFKWKASKKVGDTHSGLIFLKSSKITLKDGAIKSGEFVMNMETFTVEDLSGKWATKFLNHMKSADFFNVEKFPESKLLITDISDGVASGQLTIMGKTEPIEFKVNRDGNTYKGVMTFDRTKFGMVYGSDSFFKNLGDRVIENKVELTFKAVVAS